MKKVRYRVGYCAYEVSFYFSFWIELIEAALSIVSHEGLE